MGDKIIFEQKNNLSKNLLSFYRRWRCFDIIFIPLLWFLSCLILSMAVEIDFLSLLAWTLLVFIPIFLFRIIVMFLFIRSIFGTIKYTEKGFYAISYGGKELFIHWTDITYLKPIGDLGRFNGMRIREVPDYSLHFSSQKDYCPVSREVAEQIQEYLSESIPSSNSSLVPYGRIE